MPYIGEALQWYVCDGTNHTKQKLFKQTNKLIN